MKITDVRAVQPVAPGSPPDWRTSLGQILVAVETDAGLRGYGVGGGGLAGVHVVQTVLRDLLLDADPEAIGELWEAMYRATLPFGRKGIAIMAISGVDLALWDLCGRAAGEPVAALLAGGAGGAGRGTPHSSPPSPRSQGKPGSTEQSPAAVGEPIEAYKTLWNEIDAEAAESFRAFKLHVESAGRDDAVAAIERARERIGPERTLMIDAWMRWDVETTLAIAEPARESNLSWIEEPLPPDDVEGYAELAAKCPVPIAGGEHEFTAAGFREVVERRLHGVLQPDVCWVGGMTELLKIYRMAEEAGLRVCPHRGAEVWGLHAIAAVDPQPLAESGRPWMSWVGGQPPIVDGRVTLTDAPGFGVEIDEASLETL